MLDSLDRRKTRIELLEDRIKILTRKIEELKAIQETENIELNQLNDLKEKLQSIRTSLEAENQESEIQSGINEFKKIGILLINNEKIRERQSNEALQSKNALLHEEINRLKEEVYRRKISIAELVKSNNELLEVNSKQEEYINRLKSKTYGFDIAARFEKEKNRSTRLQNDMVINHENARNSLWENSNIYDFKQNFNEYANDKNLWINNSNANVEKLSKEVSLNKNMRKYSPIILNN